jgi:flagellar hook-associated protein 3 FlgL
MRVTNKMLSNSVLNNINLNLQKLDKSQNQLSSGTKISKPSDDPTSTAQLLAAKSALEAQEQYQSNMEDAIGWLDTTDSALASANEVLQRARELAVYGANGTLPEESMSALGDELDNLIGEMVQIGNTNYAGRYIFAGGKTTQPPFISTGDPTTAVNFVPTSDPSLLNETYKLEFEIEAGVKMNVSAGLKTFHTETNGSTGLNAVFNTMISLRDNLNNGDKTAVNDCIGDFDKLIDNVLSERAIVGAKSKRMETAQERSSAYELNLNKLMGKLEDVDYAKASIDFNVQKTVYEAALNIGAQIIKPSLIDFLK